MVLLPISLSGRVFRSREKPAVTAEEIAAVELDHEDEKLLEQMEQEADARGEDFDSEEEREKLKALKAEQAKQRLKKMRLGADVAVLGKKKPAVTVEEIAAVELDAQDEKLLDQMGQEADARGEDFDPEEEREKLKALKAEQAKQRIKKMRLYGAAMGQLSRKHLERSGFC